MPFQNADGKELLNCIVSGEIRYDDVWKGLSEDCRDFVKKLLTRNPKERMSSYQALTHPWMAKNRLVNFPG